LYLNEWREGHAEPWLDLAIWDAGEVDLGDFSPGAWCWIGVDLSATTDLTAVVALFEWGEGFLAVPWFAVPQDSLRRRAERDGVNYPLWADQVTSPLQRAAWSITGWSKATSPT
jgi:phage terminase large subunit-like protein